MTTAFRRQKAVKITGSLIVIATCVCAGSAMGRSFIVKDGRPQAEIVIADAPPRTVTLAAEELQTYVEKITGARLPITNAPGRDVPVQVYVGKSAHTDRLKVTEDGLKYGAFKIVSGRNTLVLLGRDTDFVPKEPWMRSISEKDQVLKKWDELTGDKFENPLLSLHRCYSAKLNVWEQDERGSLNAVNEFLHGLGVRWFFPGDLGEVVPKLADIALPKVDQVIRPDFPVRRMYLAYNSFFQGEPEQLWWQLRLGLNGSHEGAPDGLLGLGAPGHGILNVIGRPGVKEAHPEYFAIWAGKRVNAPCLSSEGLFQATVKYARAVYDIYGEPRVELSPTDGYASLCQCELCKGKSTPERGWDAQLSDYVWGFVDRVARELYKTHPDRKVGCLAYSAYQLPPARIAQMSPNVSVMLCRWRSNLGDPATRDQFQKLTQAWLDKLPSKDLYIWDYYEHSRPGGPTEGVPVFFPRVISDDLRFLKGKSKGDFIEITCNHPSWNLKWDALAANHLNLYVTARLYWNADEDINALLEDYYDKFYGPAGKEMKAFIEYGEENWRKAIKDVKTIDRLAELLAAARKAAGPDTIYTRRIDRLVAFIQPMLDRRGELSKGREGVPKAHAGTRDQKDITLDGKLDDKFWNGLEEYALKENRTGKEPGSATSFKMGWAGNDLYFGILCRDADMQNLNIAATQDGDSNLWLGDSVEIMLETQSHSYYQIAVSPVGAVVDLDRRKGTETLWSANAKVAAYRGDGYWSLEVRVPAAGEGQEGLDPLNGVSGNKPAAAYPWFFNVCRQRVRGEVMERAAFSPAGSDSFHAVLKFAELSVK
jgi:hypothetical protein